MKKGVLELIPDSFLESSRASLPSVWFAGTTPEVTVPRVFECVLLFVTNLHFSL